MGAAIPTQALVAGTVEEELDWKVGDRSVPVSDDEGSGVRERHCGGLHFMQIG